MNQLGLEIIVLAAPTRLSAEQALAVLRSADPQGSYALNHLYDPSAGVEGDAPARRSGPNSPWARINGQGLRIGMIDGGVYAAHPCFSGRQLTQRGFAGAATPSAHGTAVASLLVGQGQDVSGYAPGAELLAADVFGDEIEGGASEAVAAALNWLVAEGVQVVNISLEGPPNRLVELACQAAEARGVLLVAAVGNGGPSQAVAFPAAYPSVVATTAVDSHGSVYLMANRGPEVAFAALGVDLVVAAEDGEIDSVTGTSFAAPLVTALLADVQRASTDAQTSLRTLAARVQDAGPPGRDPVYGFGIIA
jgi:hypothetical protein